MRTMKRASMAAATAVMTLALVGCSEAEKAADDARNKAEDAAASAAEDASAKAEEMASEATAADDSGADGTGTDGTGTDGASDGATNGSGAGGSATDGATDGSGTGGSVAGVSVDLGDFQDDPNARAAGEFYTVREAVRSGGEGDLATVTAANHLPRVERFVANNPSDGTWQVVVVDVQGATVKACVGPQATKPRILTLEDGKVSANIVGDFSC